MLFKTLLLKIEIGKALTDKQEKSLATKLGLNKSYFQIVVDILLFAAIITLLFLTASPQFDLMTIVLFYIVAVLLLLIYLYKTIVLKRIRLVKYFKAVDEFYNVAFREFENFDLYYFGQHVSPTLKTLSSKKIYFLTDGYHFVFIDDYFKDTKYKMPKFLTNGDNTFLRVINDQALNNKVVVIPIDYIESFNITSKEVEDKQIKVSSKYDKYYKLFLDQDKYMTDKSLTILTIKDGTIMRLSYLAYEAFKKYIPYKEKV